MILLKNTKKSGSSFLVLILFSLIATSQSCKKKAPEMDTILFEKTHNPIFKDIDTNKFVAFFKNELKQEEASVSNAQLISDHYAQNNYEPDFVLYHLWDGDIDAMLNKFRKANEHGLDPKLFQVDKINALMTKLKSEDAIKTPEDAYKCISELEILTANSLVNYSNALQYGIINPKKIYTHYYIKTLNPDSASMNRVFAVENMAAYLDSIQPKSLEYLALQKAYLNGYEVPQFSKEEIRRILIVNMERLRWKNKPTEKKYVYVNIPDFHLDVIDSGKSILDMKVCVGEGRNKKYRNTLDHYNDTCKTDRPAPHETPLLNSAIHTVEVNPVWNIPTSIATKEIIVHAANNPQYLSKRNIIVYKNNKVVSNPETIDWSKAKKLGYDFKQQPGESNALGKIKFLFDNQSSVYLHDTPSKYAFGYTMRAVSHGCVRLEKPLKLASTLFPATKYKTILKDIQANTHKPDDIALRPRIPVYLTYVTCWPDKDGSLQFRKDVYGLDIVLYDHLKKYLAE